MTERFIKKKWHENDTTYFIHFVDSYAIRQIEVYQDKVIYLDILQKIDGESFLYDQSFLDLDIEEKDLISKNEFEIMWKK